MVKRIHPRSKGFTLLEVMVAVAIISIVLVTLIGSQSQSVSVAAISRFDTVASLLAQEKLAELVAADFALVSNEEGDFGEDFSGYQWRLEVTDLTEDETGIVGAEDLLKSVDIFVQFGSEDVGETFFLRSILMQKIIAEEK